MRVDITGCARCDGPGHLGVEFKPLTHPVATEFICDCGHTHVEEAAHWAPCPVNGEPILLCTKEV